mmetsp:Transcript_8152/g.34261  ORF Transcript_8152/g.34261 Transcript_8152/m.34261 type:complete len:266 (-) Transcript_8152:300-1097(-)
MRRRYEDVADALARTPLCHARLQRLQELLGEGDDDAHVLPHLLHVQLQVLARLHRRQELFHQHVQRRLVLPLRLKHLVRNLRPIRLPPPELVHGLPSKEATDMCLKARDEGHDLPALGHGELLDVKLQPRPDGTGAAGGEGRAAARRTHCLESVDLAELRRNLLEVLLLRAVLLQGLGGDLAEAGALPIGRGRDAGDDLVDEREHLDGCAQVDQVVDVEELRLREAELLAARGEEEGQVVLHREEGQIRPCVEVRNAVLCVEAHH